MFIQVHFSSKILYIASACVVRLSHISFLELYALAKTRYKTDDHREGILNPTYDKKKAWTGSGGEGGGRGGTIEVCTPFWLEIFFPSDGAP